MTVILIHGAPALPSVWDPLLPFLPEDTRTPELLDSRAGRDTPATLQESLDDLTAHCLAVPGQLTLVGHSAGAWLAMRIAERHPGKVTRAVCLAGCAEMPEGFGQELLGFAEALESGALPLDAASEVASQRWFEKDEHFPDRTDAARKFIEQMSVTGAARALRRCSEMSRFPQLRTNSITDVRVIHGVSDLAVPLPLGQAAKAAARSYREVLLDTASHYLQWSHPEAVASAVLD